MQDIRDHLEDWLFFEGISKFNSYFTRLIVSSHAETFKIS